MCLEELVTTQKIQSALSVDGLRQQSGNILILWQWNILCWIFYYCFSAPCISLCLFQINFNCLHSRCTHTQHLVLHKLCMLPRCVTCLLGRHDALCRHQGSKMWSSSFQPKFPIFVFFSSYFSQQIFQVFFFIKAFFTLRNVRIVILRVCIAP